MCRNSALLNSGITMSYAQSNGSLKRVGRENQTFPAERFVMSCTEAERYL